MQETLDLIESERQKLFGRFGSRLEVAPHFSRRVVSFQGNKKEPVYRWFKYKEGFSSELVAHFLKDLAPEAGRILDPFAGVGTTLFASQEVGWDACGIELLPVGAFVMEIREVLRDIDVYAVRSIRKSLWDNVESMSVEKSLFQHISITKDAFPVPTEKTLQQFLAYCQTVGDSALRSLLRFAAFSVLEEVSFTRKDGQYLRWDYHSNRELSGKPFDKGKILGFREAVDAKLDQMTSDLTCAEPAPSLWETRSLSGNGLKPVTVVQGSCLVELPRYEANSFDFVLTSPPYCNRYDYTRTYALELVFLGCDNERVKSLRQGLLSCTVENKEKVEQLREHYRVLSKLDFFSRTMEAYDASGAMTEVNDILEELVKLDRLNNNNVPRMVRNYFLELCFVIHELGRVLRRGGRCVMVNDNVRYGGEDVPVDLILSEFAESFGFEVEKIYVLPRGKGNSSQQMGNYGRTETRKCIYVWRKK